MTDKQTTVAELRRIVRQFVDEREWQKFHAPKNLCMALSIEVAELAEHFQWISAEESRQLKDPETAEAVADELADVVCYALALANELDIDLSSALRAKMVKNRQKYPASEFRGKFE